MPDPQLIQVLIARGERKLRTIWIFHRANFIKKIWDKDFPIFFETDSIGVHIFLIFSIYLFLVHVFLTTFLGRIKIDKNLHKFFH